MTGFEWIVACVAPWAVSPHPNFSQKGVRAPGLLALVAEMRAYELERYEDSLTDALPAEKLLIEQAAASISDATQREATESLEQVSADASLPIGLRAAAALYACVALGELEEPERAIALLRRLLGELESPQLTGTASLILAVLHQQLSLRLYEAGRFSEARSALRRVRSHLRSSTSPYQDFAVSDGIGWNSQRVTRDIRSSVEAHSWALDSRLESIGGRSWVKVVRRRPTWPDIRVRFAAGARDGHFVDEVFEDRVEAYRNRVILVRSDRVEASAYTALLVSELAGSINGVLSNREALGKLRILRGDGEFSVREGIRLLRQSESKSALESALQWTRAKGSPTDLAAAARVILQRPTYPTRTNTYDLLVLSACADLLRADEALTALDGIWDYLDLGRERRVWTDRTIGWRAVRSLLNAGVGSASVWAPLLSEVQSNSEVDPLLADVLVDVVRAIDWQMLSEDQASSWASWAKRRGGTKETKSLRAAVLGSLNGSPVLEHGEDVVRVRILENSSSAAAEEIDAAIELTFSKLERIRTNAAKGMTAFGGIDEVELAVALADAFEEERLWPAIVGVLVDPNVDYTLKSRGLDRMTRLSHAVPSDSLAALTDGWMNLRASKRSFGASTAAPQLPEAARVAASLGIQSRRELIEEVTRLSGRDDSRSQIEACRSAFVIGTRMDAAEWAHVILLQLSSSPEPNVAAEAGKNLVLASSLNSTVSDLVHDRITELLKADRIRTPLFALHGFQRLVFEEIGSISADHLALIRRLEIAHLSNVVRGAASEVLRLAD